MKVYIIQNGKNCRKSYVIESLLQIKSDNRPNINNVIDSILYEDLKKFDEEKNKINNAEYKLKEKNLENESNKINQNNIINNLDNTNNIKKNDINYGLNFVLQRLRLEYELCNRDDDLLNLGCIFGLECNNIYKWRITLLGPQNTPYEGGLSRIS